MSILGVNVRAQTLDGAVDTIAGWIDRREPNYVCVTGVHGVMESQDDDNLRRLHNQAGMVTTDGMPLVWLTRRRAPNGLAVERVYGPDLMLAAFERSESTGWRHFLYGASSETLDALQTELRRRFPRAQIVGALSPPFRPLTPDEDRAIDSEIAAARPDIVWVGLSTPKQERWMAARVDRLGVPVLVGVGAAFDFHSGFKRQAPKWVQRSGLEWAFRLASEPRRLAGRYLRNNPRFVFMVARESFSGHRRTEESPVRERFYYETIRRLLDDGWLVRDDDVLVVAGDHTDREVLLAAGLRSVTISNLDDMLAGDEFEPYVFSRQNAERLDLPDRSVDVAIVHQGLHHCRSPHRGLLELYRVARRGVVVFEPQETLLTRAGVRFGIGQQYEFAAVADHDLRHGGVENSDIPNFVYRWTRREARKTLASFDPTGAPRVRFFYDLRVPDEAASRIRSRPARVLGRVALPAVRTFLSAFPSQANAIAIVADRLDPRVDAHPWLSVGTDGVRSRAEWFDGVGARMAEPDR